MQTRIHPHAFGLDKARVRLKRNAEDKLKGLYLPFTLATSFCTVVFEDADQGSFCYELVGEATLPSVFSDTRLSVDVTGLQQRWLHVPFVNHQLDAARKVFLDRHPLAKDKEQAALARNRLTGATPAGGAYEAHDSFFALCSEPGRRHGCDLRRWHLSSQW